MDLIERNLSVISDLKLCYEQYKNSLYEVEKIKENLFTVKINNIYIHSKYDPIKESERIINILLEDKSELDVLIIFGFGLGYITKIIFDILIKNNKSKIKPYLICIEKDIKLFLTSLKYFDHTELLINHNVKFFLDSEKELIGSFIQSIPTKHVRYYYHRPSYFLEENYYKNTQKYINYILDRKDMNASTFKRFQKLWTKNIINNLPFFSSSNHLNKLNNVGTGTTVIVIAGGPNLEKCINYIKSVKDKAILIAVDTVYKYLKKNNITPDIIATIDPQYWNYKFLENEKIDQSIIVTDFSVYYKVFQIAKTNKYFIGNSIFPLAKYFDNYCDRGTLGAGGSVATVAYDTARILGANNIILLGLDLSFPDRMTHFRGAFFETNFLSISNYFKTAEDNSYHYLTHVNLELIDSTKGKVFSDTKMILFKKWFDREILLTKAKVYLPDLGGAKIEGTTILTLDKLPIPDQKTKDNFKNQIKILLENNNQNNLTILIEKIEKFLKISKEIRNSYSKIIKMIPDNGKVKNDVSIVIGKEEEKILSDNNKNEIVKVLSSAAQDVLISIIENYNYSNNDNEKESAWIKTKILYKSIVESSDFYENILQKTLKIIYNQPKI